MARSKKIITAGIISFMILSMAGSGWTAQAEALLSDLQPHQVAVRINPGIDSRQSNSPKASPGASEEQVEYEVIVPWESLLLETVEKDGQSYVQVTLPGWTSTAEPGKPGLPLQLDQLGIPVGAAVSIDVNPGKAHTFPLDAPVLPVVTQTVEYIFSESGDEMMPFSTEKTFVFAQDPAVYGGGVYPGVLADIAGDVMLRQQRVVSIASYPVQYNADRQELTVFENLRVVVSFDGAQSVSSAQGSAESAAFEELLAGELLNYETAQAYRTEEMPLTPEAELLIPDEGGATSLQDMLGASLPWTPPSPGYRVKVRADGMYRLTYSELQAKGLPVGTLDPRSFQMFNLGEEVYIRVVGETDGVFSDGDYIVFYGSAITNKYTWDNVYWLTYGNTTQGLRMAERNGAPGGATTPTTHTAYRHFEGYASYNTQAPGDAELDRWMWKYMYRGTTATVSWSTTISIPAYATGAATMRVAMVGLASYIPVAKDHRAKVFINGTEVADLTWDGKTWLPMQNITIDAGVLVAGNNTVKVDLLYVLGVPTDSIYVDWIELDFPNNYTAENNELAFKYGTAGTWKFQAGGFTSNQLGVYDVTSGAQPVYLSGAVISPASPYTLTFQDTTTTSTRHWTGALKSVQAIEADTASSLQSTANGADHIVITHQAFASSAAALSSYRAGQMRAVAVDVQDIYDEFNYGIVHPAPIHDFLAYTYANWQAPAPSYVVLMGDGTSDPKNYLVANTRVSYIPPYLMPIDPGKLETAADNRYVTIVGTDIMPDMMLGRFSVNTTAEADIMVNKVIAYETAQAGGWQQQVLAVADNIPDTAGNFHVLSDNLLADELPTPPYSPTKIYLGTTSYPTSTPALAREAIVDNFGKLLVNYIGHGYSNGWASESIFRYHPTNDSLDEVRELTNGNNMPVMLSMDCNDGYFINPQQYSLAQEALAEGVTRVGGGGAVASWSPSGEGVASGHDYLNRGFFRALFEYGVDTVGEATIVGKLSLLTFPDLLDTYLLFGDPALDMPTVEIANDAPVITGQVPLSINEDTALTITLSNLTVTDPDNDYPADFTLTVLSGANYTVSGATVTPAANYYGTLTVPVRVNDGMVNSNIYNLTVSVTAVNDAPMAVEDTYTTPQDTPLVIQASALKTNDTDVDNTNEQLSVTSVSSPTNGSVSITDGTVTFTPATGFMGLAGFTYTVTDGQLPANGQVIVDVSEPKTPQTITVTTHAPANAIYGTTFSVAATSSSGLTVTYSSGAPSVCTNSGAQFTLVSGTGTCVVQYDQTGNDIYAPAPRVSENLDAQKASQAITITQHAPLNATIGTVFNVAATASSGLEVVYSSGNPMVCTVQSTAFIVGSDSGTCVVQYDQSGSSNYLAATQLVEYVEIVTSHSIALVQGWNLVSFNLVPVSSNIADVLDSIDGKYDLVYAWDATGASSGTGNWKMYDPDVLIPQSLTALSNGMGFWILMTQAATLDVSGTIPTTTSVSLLTSAGGWNLVGYPSAGSEALPGALTDHGVGSTDYSLVYAYHAAELEDVWKMFDSTAVPYANDLTAMDPGWGYWIKVSSAGTWSVDY